MAHTLTCQVETTLRYLNRQFNILHGNRSLLLMLIYLGLFLSLRLMLINESLYLSLSFRTTSLFIMGALNTLHATNELYGTNSDIICCEYLFVYSNMNFQPPLWSSG
jgi:hypothetical protein